MPMPTVMKGAPVASRIPPHENRAMPRVAPDENQAESLRPVAPDENQEKSLCTSLPMRIAAASPRCSARYENRVPPDPYAKPYSQAGLQARTIHRRRYLRIFRANVIAVGRQTISLGEKCARKADAESKRLRSRKKQRFIFLFYHTKARKATGRNANMQFVYTADQAEKQSTVACLHILHLLPLQLKILREKSC